MASFGVLLGAAILRIAIDAPGVYHVPAEAIADAGLAELQRPAGLYVGTPTPTAVPYTTDERGGIVFVADVRSRHARETVFVLREQGSGDPPQRVETTTCTIERNDHYDPLETEERLALEPFGYGRADYFYFAKPSGAQKHRIAVPPLAAGGPKVPASIVLQGDRRAAASNGVDLLWDGKRVGGTIRWSGPGPVNAGIELDAEQLAPGEHTLEVSVRDGNVRLDKVRFSAAPAGAPRKPVSIEKAAPEDLREGGADWLAITVDACTKALEPLAAHREKRGLRTRIVRLQDVFDGFSEGSYDPRAIRRFLEHASKSWKPAPRFVLLAGEATYDVAWLRPPGETLPAALVDTYDNGASASDNWFVAYTADVTIPSIAIGRFPVSSAAATKMLVDRTIAYETRSPTGPWRRKLSFVAGEGRFGEQVDRAIEELALTIFNEYIPQGFELNMTYASLASPYLWIPQKLTDKVVERLNEGALLLNYTGHGATWGLDDLRFRGKNFPVFRTADVARVKCGEKRPIVLITACWTGCFDDPKEEPVGEALFEHEAGPAAVFASSRISHPFSNAVLSKELVAGLFGAEMKGKRLGEVLVESKRLMLTAKDQYRDMIATYGMLFLADPLLLVRLLQDDLHLYNLLGDPALALPFPAGEVKLEAAGPAVAGKKLKVRGLVEGVKDGKAIVTFEVERKTIYGDLEPVELEKPGADKRIAENYEIANDKVIVKVDAKVRDGAFEAELKLPDDLLFTRHYVKAYAWSERADALGALAVTVTDDE